MAIKLLFTKNSMMPPHRFDEKRSTLPNTSAKLHWYNWRKITLMSLTSESFLPFLFFDTRGCIVSYKEGNYTRLRQVVSKTWRQILKIYGFRNSTSSEWPFYHILYLAEYRICALSGRKKNKRELTTNSTQIWYAVHQTPHQDRGFLRLDLFSNTE